MYLGGFTTNFRIGGNKGLDNLKIGSLHINAWCNTPLYSAIPYYPTYSKRFIAKTNVIETPYFAINIGNFNQVVTQYIYQSFYLTFLLKNSYLIFVLISSPDCSVPDQNFDFHFSH